MKTKELTTEEEIIMRETVDNQTSIKEQEETRAVLEAKYNNTEESVEQDSLREQIDRINEIVVEENYVEEDNLDDWSSVDDNPYYNDNLDMDQQSPEFWDNL